MSGFPSEWLRLREPYDHAARDPRCAEILDEALPERAVDIVDLGCGLGSGLRWLAPRLGRPQRWFLVDHDPALLAAIPAEMERWALEQGQSFRAKGDGWLVGERLELIPIHRDLDQVAFDRDFPSADAIVTQALLDLLDGPTLDRLVDRLAGRPLLAALTVDGRNAWIPEDPDDEAIASAFRAHQTHGKPGIAAAARVADRARSLGYRVHLAEADWRIGGDDREMMREMVDGARTAAAEMAGDDAVSAWYGRRRADVDRGAVGMRVGHLDLVAVRGGARG